MVDTIWMVLANITTQQEILHSIIMNGATSDHLAFVG